MVSFSLKTASALLLVALSATTVQAAPLSKRVAQDISASTAKWEQACNKAGGGLDCNPTSVNAFQTLLIGAGICDQQDAADKMIDLAKKLNSDPEMIRLTQIFVQQPRNTPNSLAVPYCQKTPRNAELQGLFQCQFQGANQSSFVGGFKIGDSGTLPAGMAQPPNPLGSCLAHPAGPIADGTQLVDQVQSPGVGGASNSTTTASGISTSTDSASIATATADGTSTAISTDSFSVAGTSTADIAAPTDGASSSVTDDSFATATDSFPAAPTASSFSDFAASDPAASDDASSSVVGSVSATATDSTTAAALATNTASTSKSVCYPARPPKATSSAATDSPSASATDVGTATDSALPTATDSTLATATDSAFAIATESAFPITTDSVIAATATDSAFASATEVAPSATNDPFSAYTDVTAPHSVTSAVAASFTAVSSTASAPSTSATPPATTGSNVRVSTGNTDNSTTGATSSDFHLQNGLDAQKLNASFKALTANSSCNEGDQACIAGGFAQCVSGRFVISPCSSGLVCQALPLVAKPGTSLACTSVEDGLARIQATGATGGIDGS